ncbi:hypothetical protein BPAE_0047g00280 [Botrytis paeoniae]|uniref:Uncharacterized protein n=1 Tax=Botrytis paeoniae TaxID=278948 RepID=A0A4Z1FVS6_9HELO|nr:hypothetical protein BPAE_0047g00280 [Botrytis paeoniae]
MTSEASRVNSRRSDSRYADSGTKGSVRPSRLGPTRSRNGRRRSVESLESDTRYLNIGGRDSPQPSESPGDTVDPSIDTQLLDYEANWKAPEKKKRSDNHDNDKNLPSSDQRYGDSSRPSTRKEKDKNTERKTEESSPAGSDVSSPKTSVSSKPESATSSRHGAPTHRSASVGDHKDKASRAGSYHSSKSASFLKEYDEVDNEPSPGEPKALSKGSAGGSLHGRTFRSNTPTLGHHSLEDSNLNNIYKPDRGGKGTSTTAPSDHGSAERAQTGYGRGDEKNQPCLYDNRVIHYNPPKSTSSKASRSTSTAAISNHAASERAPSSCGEAAEDQSCAYEDETRQSNASGSTGRTTRGRRSPSAVVETENTQNIIDLWLSCILSITYFFIKTEGDNGNVEAIKRWSNPACFFADAEFGT